MKKIISSPKGFTPRNFTTDPLGYKYVEVVYGKRGRLGKFLKIKKTKRVKVPNKMRVLKISNHTPKVGQVTVTYGKR